MDTTKIKIFISYSHQDDAYLEKDSLLGFIQGLEQDNIEFWTDLDIKTGELWDDEIQKQIQSCDIALVLVSQFFLDSYYAQTQEIQNFLTGKKHLFPVILSACDWKRHEWLASRQFLPGGEQTIEEHFSDQGARKRLFHEIRKQLLERANIIRQSEKSDHNPLQKYYQRCIERWSAPHYALDARFVDLTLLLDQGADAQGARWQAKHDSFQTLQQVLAATPDPVVLLGAPGCGKSTLLRHFELENAQAGLMTLEADGAVEMPLTFFIQLNEFKGKRPGDPPPLPIQWLSERWAQRHPELPALPDLLMSGRITLLLDALNEIPYRSQEVIQLWKDFLADDCLSKNSQTRVIFSCRSLDYSAPLSSADNLVHQVRIESLSDDKVRRFLLQYSPDHGEALWAKLENSPQLPLFRSPYFLKMLIEESAAGEIPSGRAELFTAFVRRLLRREIEKGNALFQAGELLHSRDIQRLIQTRRGKTSWELPKRGIFLAKLSLLAYLMQGQYNRQESGQVKIDYDQALELLDHPLDKQILEAGIAMDVLEQDLEEDQVYYIHQLIQEYFAAQQLTENPEPQLASQEWRTDRVSPSLAQTLKTLPDSEPLPPLDATGWEETLLLASAMQQNPDTLITELMSVNLPLAARCAAQPDVPVSDALKQKLQSSLLERTQNPSADLRARIAAGFALGELGDPRLQKGRGADGDFLLPPMIAIPDGEYTIGSDEGLYDDEAPAHTVTLPAFQIGQFPVTNAEWDLFIKAGGYDDPRWWQGAAAQAWRRGENTDAGPKQQWREDRLYFQENFSQIREWQREGRITSKQADEWELIAQWSEDEFADWLNEQFPGGQLTEPYVWYDDAYNQAAQPVVGICWHEARAYCTWLSTQSDRSFRLPTEAEWEAAARGKSARRFAYGDKFDSAHANTFESHIRATTPIAVFPGGSTPEGLQDMTGNVWEWTSSLLLDYPYQTEQAPENEEATDGPRVVRGGSWNNHQDNARAAYRNNNLPGNRNNNLGFRLLSSSHIVPLLHKVQAGIEFFRFVRAVAWFFPTLTASGIERRRQFTLRSEGFMMAQVSPARTRY